MNTPHDLPIDQCSMEESSEELTRVRGSNLPIQESPGKHTALVNQLAVEFSDPAIARRDGAGDMQDGVISEGLQSLRSLKDKMLQ